MKYSRPAIHRFRICGFQSAVFHPWLVESTDMEPMVTEGRLHCPILHKVLEQPWSVVSVGDPGTNPPQVQRDHCTNFRLKKNAITTLDCPGSLLDTKVLLQPLLKLITYTIVWCDSKNYQCNFILLQQNEHICQWSSQLKSHLDDFFLILDSIFEEDWCVLQNATVNLFIYLFKNIYLFGCIGFQLWHTGSLLLRAGSFQLQHAGSLSCGRQTLSCGM